MGMDKEMNEQTGFHTKLTPTEGGCDMRLSVEEETYRTYDWSGRGIKDVRMKGGKSL